MAEFYNAETLLEFVKQNTPHIDGETTMKCVERAIKEAPTADVVEVVRCEKCKHKVDFYGRLMCGRLKYEFNDGVGGLVATVPEHFCGYGERRDT